MEIKSIARVLENNREKIIEAKKILDSAAALSLLGASIDPVARGMLITGTMAATGSAALLAGIAVTGIGGPVLLGMALVPTVAKIGLGTGIALTIGGFIRGFREGVRQSHITEQNMKSFRSLLEEHGLVIDSANIQALFTPNKIIPVE